MYKVKDFYDFLCDIAPLELKMDFDNPGFLIGESDLDVTGAMIALDITANVITEAIDNNCNLIITHHPVIFKPMKSIISDIPEQNLVLKLIKAGISVISMHTNLDIAEDGVNDTLIRLLGLEPKGTLLNTKSEEVGCGRIGEYEREVPLFDFLSMVKKTLSVKGIKYYNAGKPVKKLAVMGGAGGDCAKLAFEKGCDTYLTSDIKYHEYLEAKELGINFIDADHFCTENPVMEKLYNKIKANFNVPIYLSQSHKQYTDIFV